MRIAKVPTWGFADVIVQEGAWGSNRPRFAKWIAGETLVLLVGQEGVVFATVTGKPFTSNRMIWEDDLYEYRIPVHVEKVLRGAMGTAANEAVHKALAADLGNVYGAYIMSQSKLPEEVELLVKKAL